VACAMWAVSNNFWWFLAATLMNSFEHVNQTAWQCLLVEDAQEKDINDMYTWIHICGLSAVFFAPLSGLFINRYSLVPVMRVLYAIFALNMLIKTYVTWRYTTETAQGKIRKAQTKNVPVSQMILEYKRVFPLLFKGGNMVRIFIITVLLSISGMVTSTFFGLYANLNLGVSQTLLAVFPILRAIIMLVFFFGLAKMLDRFKMKKPLMTGLILNMVALTLLILSPKSQLWPLILYTLLESVSNCLVMPRKDSMLMIGIDKEERARILALVVGCSFICTAPFGYLSGLLSQLDRRLPFLFALLLYGLCALVMSRYKDTQDTAD
jgi:Major Facilitator Superfamily.